MQSFFGKWGKQVKELAKSRNWYDDASRKKRNKAVIISVVIMILCVAGTILYGPWMLIPVGLSFAFMIGSLFIYHRTERGEITFRRWMKMKKQLRKQKFSDQEENFDATKINEYLIYGIALGLGERFYRDIFKSLEQSGNESFLWWVAIYPGTMASFSKTVGDVITTTSTTVSSVSGAGGAGVAGGGGGAASGGGGAS